MKEVTLRRNAWFGDEEESFTFPDGWDVTVYPPSDGEAMSDAQIREALANPIGTERLASIARGKKSAVVIVDDLSRPTPAERLAPFVIAELHEAGIPDDAIRFVVGGGAHRPLNEEEIAKKLGKELAERYEVSNHDTYSGTLTALGNLEDGTPVYLNEVVAQSEVKIGLAGIYPHPGAGLGGGGKIVVPGVVGIATIAYNHINFPSRGRGPIERAGEEEDMRDNAEKVARYIGLDIIVNSVVNSRREVAGLFVGDVVQAHRAGCQFAHTVYGTAIPREATESTDIVFINAYPQDMDPVQVGKSTWPLEVFKNAYKVVMDAACDGILYHGLMDRMDYGRFLRLRGKTAKVDVPREPAVTSKDQMVMLSEHFPPEDFYRHNENGVLFASWERLIGELQRVCPTGKVAVIPCSPIQLPKIV